MAVKKEIDCKVVTKGYEGTVKLALLKYRERLALVRECNFDIKQEKGEVVVGAVSSNLLALEKLMEIAPKYIRKVDVTHVASKKKAQSWEEIEYDPDFDMVAQEIAFLIINGVKLGEA